MIIEIKTLLAKGGESFEAKSCTNFAGKEMPSGIKSVHERENSMQVIRSGDFSTRVKIKDKGDHSLRTPSERAQDVSLSFEHQQVNQDPRFSRHSARADQFAARPTSQPVDRYSNSRVAPVQQRWASTEREIFSKNRFAQRLSVMNQSLCQLEHLRPSHVSAVAGVCHLGPCTFKVTFGNYRLM